MLALYQTHLPKEHTTLTHSLFTRLVTLKFPEKQLLKGRPPKLSVGPLPFLKCLSRIWFFLLTCCRNGFQLHIETLTMHNCGLYTGFFTVSGNRIHLHPPPGIFHHSIPWNSDFQCFLATGEPMIRNSFYMQFSIHTYTPHTRAHIYN